jgi:hypothetical protein
MSNINESIYDATLKLMNDPLPYGPSVHHLLLAIAADVKTDSLAADTLTMLLLRYGGRLERNTIAQVAQICGLPEDTDSEALWKTLMAQSGSLISLLNRHALDPEATDQEYQQALAEFSPFIPKRRQRTLASLLSMGNDDWFEASYQSTAKLLQQLPMELEDISQGVPSYLPKDLVKILGTTEEMRQCLAHPYLLLWSQLVGTFYLTAAGR